MSISILITVGEHPAPIGGALASVRAQLNGDWELLVADHTPGGVNRAIVHEFARATQRPVKYIQCNEADGNESSRSRLLEVASGDLVACLEPSDRWTPSHLAIAVEELNSSDITTSDVRGRGGRPVRRQPVDLATTRQLMANPARSLLAEDVLAITSAVTFRRDLVKRVGGLDSQFRVIEMRDFWVRCALAEARFSVTRRATCCSLPINAPDPELQLQIAEDTVRFHEKHRDVAAVPAALRRRLLSDSLVTEGRIVRATDPERAARCFWRAWSLQPVKVQTLGQYALTGPRGTSIATGNARRTG